MKSKPNLSKVFHLESQHRLQVIQEPRQWDTVQPAWDKLFQCSPNASPPLHWEWLRRWWNVYGEKYGQSGGLRILTVWRETELVGALPLYINVLGRSALSLKRLVFVSTGEAEEEEICPDYMDLLYMPGEASACLSSISRWIAAREDRWDIIELNHIASSSPLLGLRDQADLGPLRVTVSPQGSCPVAELSGDFESYLSRLSSANRQQIRRQLRSVEAARVSFEIARETSEADVFFHEMSSLHQARWIKAGKPGCFASERFTQFHANLSNAWVPGGMAILARVSAGGRAIAVLYGFECRGTFHFYQSGIELEVPGIRSPGVAAHLLLMRFLASRGVSAYDFLRGSSTYKMRLSTRENPLSKLEIYPPFGRHAVKVASGVAKRALRNCLRRSQSAVPHS